MLELLELILDFIISPRFWAAFLVIAGGALLVFVVSYKLGTNLAATLALVYAVVVGATIEHRWRIFRNAMLGVHK